MQKKTLMLMCQEHHFKSVSRDGDSALGRNREGRDQGRRLGGGSREMKNYKIDSNKTCEK